MGRRPVIAWRGPVIVGRGPVAVQQQYVGMAARLACLGCKLTPLFTAVRAGMARHKQA